MFALYSGELSRAEALLHKWLRGFFVLKIQCCSRISSFTCFYNRIVTDSVCGRSLAWRHLMTNSAFLQMINFAGSSVVPHCFWDKTLFFLHDILGFMPLPCLHVPLHLHPSPSCGPPCSAVIKYVCCSAMLCHPVVPLFTLSGMFCLLFGSVCLLCLCDSTPFTQ